MEHYTTYSDKKNKPINIDIPTTFDELMQFAHDHFTSKTAIRSYAMKMTPDSFVLVVRNVNGTVISHIIYSRGNKREGYNTGYVQIDCSNKIERSIKEMFFIMICFMYELK